MKTRNILLTISVLLLFNCGKKPIEDENYIIKYFLENDIPEPRLLKGIKYDLSQFLLPRHLLVMDDYLILAEKGNNDLFYIYDVKTLDFIKSIGKNGLGPGEITMCYTLSKGSGYGEFWAYDTSAKSLFGYDINEDTKLAVKEVKQGETLTMAVDLLHTTDSTFMTRLMHGNSMFVELSLSGDTISTHGTWDKLLYKPNVPSHVTNNVLQGGLKASPDKEYFSCYGVWKDYIEILNRKTGVITSVRGPVNFEPKFDVDHSRGFAAPSFKEYPHIQHADVFMGNKSIFSLYLGKNNEDVYENPNPQVKIFEFDYDGNILNQFVINYPLISISVDENVKKIYAISLDKNPNLVVFDYGPDI